MLTPVPEEQTLGWGWMQVRQGMEGGNTMSERKPDGSNLNGSRGQGNG